MATTTGRANTKRARTAKPVGGGTSTATIFGVVPVSSAWSGAQIATMVRVYRRAITTLTKLPNYDADLVTARH